MVRIYMDGRSKKKDAQFKVILKMHLKKYSKISYIVKSNNTPVIQENHKLIFHLISEILDQYY